MTSKTIKKAIYRSVLFASGCYIALLLYLYNNQRDLIFRGSTFKTHLDMRTVHGKDAALEMVPTEDGGKCAVLFAPALTKLGMDDPEAHTRPYVLFFYGNGSSLTSSLGIIYQLQIRGMNVCSADYPGYGDSTGVASEKGNFEAATVAYDYLTQTRKIPASRIVISGWSLGAAAAIDLATRVPHAALVTCGAFTSMVAMSNHLYPIVPVPILNVILKYRFDNIDKMPLLMGPILMVHGRMDKFIPYESCGLLAAACKGDVTRYTVGTGDHDQLFDAGGAPLYDVIAGFCHKHVPAA